ncbi:MAG: bifunctional adenosylcobinamide kinase/adenosylcobinamide-phosphate guanylyltransferase [Thioalkalivibrio sp.]|jgi:adenosylcobinamide kinase/adenosylcobinamide-phosphate guanylyltransferase|nr:bifunctional adenosylcobinamide kinase/adenosylcobinamide-phosphate guanylyltransferase [Thioalkalivibrio sp.]NBB94754.1 bifunctional adenosylcobinamide kinase/adenosylcobinamide-phosphate guanylyltransferase [Planctomycetota bacterium]
MAEVILITGGARSGKSAEALRLTDGFARRVFIATAEAFDEEMRQRIERHQAERGNEWETVEEPLDLAGAVRRMDDPQSAVVIDCLTVWLGNLMHRDANTAEDAPSCAELVDALRRSCAGRVIVVTNEVGMGIVPEHALSRRYRDVAGRLNQRVAAIADRVILMVSGQPLVVKPAGRAEGDHV